MKIEKWRGKSEDFFGSAKNIELILFRIFELRWFQICFQIFHIFLGSKVTALQSGSTLALLGRFSPSLQSCNFWSKKDMKNLTTDLESAKFILLKWTLGLNTNIVFTFCSFKFCGNFGTFIGNILDYEKSRLWLRLGPLVCF